MEVEQVRARYDRQNAVVFPRAGLVQAVGIVRECVYDGFRTSSSPGKLSHLNFRRSWPIDILSPCTECVATQPQEVEFDRLKGMEALLAIS